MAKQKTITAYKGFDKDFKCLWFQFETGKTFKHKGNVEVCSSGFHACTTAIDVLAYYSTADSRFSEVELSGDQKTNGADSKVASAEITIKAELSLPEFLKLATEQIISTAKKIKNKTGYSSAATSTGNRSAATNTGDYSAATSTGNRSAATSTGDRGAATSTGYSSAATSTGDRGAATNTGYSSAATNTGDYSAATSTGNRSAATNTGYSSAAAVQGKRSVAIVTGLGSKAMAAEGSAIVLCEYDDSYNLKKVHSAIAGKTKGVKPDTWYTAKNGKLVEVTS